MHFIFERATRKLKGDLSLWLGWLQLCKDSHSSKSLSKVAAARLLLCRLLFRSCSCCFLYATLSFCKLQPRTTSP